MGGGNPSPGVGRGGGTMVGSGRGFLLDLGFIVLIAEDNDENKRSKNRKK